MSNRKIRDVKEWGVVAEQWPVMERSRGPGEEVALDRSTDPRNKTGEVCEDRYRQISGCCPSFSW